MSYVPANITAPDPEFVGTYGSSGSGLLFHGRRWTAPTSSAYVGADTTYFYPFYVGKTYSLARWWWLNGATVGTNYVQVGIYNQDRILVKASPRTLSAGTANYVQYANPGIHGTNVTSGGDITDADTYTTASVTLRQGVLYVMSVENSHATDGAAVASIDSATSGYPTFTSRSTTTYDSTNKRVSMWSGVPTTGDWTGTLRINFSASSGTTGCVWALNAFYHVDTTTNDGIVNQAVGTGNSATSLATLPAYGSAENVGHAAFGIAGNTTGLPPTAATKELSDSGIATPAQALHTSMAYNDTTMDYSETSAQWGACAVEIKSLGTGAIAIPPMRGWLAIHCNGTTATFFRKAASEDQRVLGGYIQASQATGLPVAPTFAAGTGIFYNFGFTSRATP